MPSTTIKSFAASIGLPCNSRFHSSTVRLVSAGFGVAAGAAAGPAMKRKSSVSDEESQGVWRPSVALFTARRTRLKVSSIGIPGCFAAASNAVVYGLLAPLPSSASAPGDVENETKVPGAPTLASTMASPCPAVLLRSGNGLLRQASSSTMRIRLGTEVSVFRMSLRRTAWIGISASRFGSTSTGTR